MSRCRHLFGKMSRVSSVRSPSSRVNLRRHARPGGGRGEIMQLVRCVSWWSVAASSFQDGASDVVRGAFPSVSLESPISEDVGRCPPPY
jgi:hypothetical protein